MRTALGAAVLAVAAILATGAGAASSATTAAWTVSPGGPVKAKTSTARLTDTSTGNTLPCSSRMSGTLRSGSGLSGPGIGSIAEASFPACGGPEGLLRLSVHGLPWQLDLTSYNRRTETARGMLSHLRLFLSGPTCTAAIDGTSGTASGVVAVTYSDKTGELKILPSGGNLHWQDVHGCLGLVGDGDPATLTGTYAVTPIQTITSP